MGRERMHKSLAFLPQSAPNARKNMLILGSFFAMKKCNYLFIQQLLSFVPSILMFSCISWSCATCIARPAGENLAVLFGNISYMAGKSAV